MRVPTSRRSFLKGMSAWAATIAAVGACNRFWSALPRGSIWNRTPLLDGTMSFDEASRELMAVDFSETVRRVPAAVLRPRSRQDVVKMLRFANEHQLPLAMRGQGHSQYGRSLVKDGIAIDSKSLNAVTLEPSGFVYAQAGATWEEVTRATLAHGLTPPALGDTMSLSVGGILSAGGISNNSHHFGAVVDNVTELDVVTGAGDLVTCSLDRNRELFELTLGGMGQCALILGARLRLMPAASWVVRRDLFYDDLTSFLSDLRILATDGRFDHLGALVISRGVGTGWNFKMSVGKFSATPEVDFATALAGLRFASKGDPVATTYAGYLHREDARNNALMTAHRETSQRWLNLTMFVPWSGAEVFLRRILVTPEDTAGLTRLSLYMLPMRNFKRPMFMMPREDLTCAFFLNRSVPTAENARYLEMVATVRKLDLEMRDAGGKAYPPYAPFYSSADWEAHYGAAWPRLTEGKRRFDPRNILTPGMRMSGPDRLA